MSISNAKKTVDKVSMECNGTTNVTISFDAAAELINNPADIVLIMDRSGSMSGERLAYSKTAAKKLIKMTAEASGDPGSISDGSYLGIVSFANTATADTGLTQNLSTLYQAIDGLSAGGSTNHKDAFEKAAGMLNTQTNNRRIIVMFTDGVTTVGGDALPVTDNLKASGVEIFCIGLTQNTKDLDAWASDPDDIHVVSTMDPALLENLFEKTAAEVVEAGARDVVIEEELNPDFKLIKVNLPSAGTVQITGNRTLVWTIDTAGASRIPQTVSLSFQIMHTGTSGGTKAVNKSLLYKDRVGTKLTFPDPVVQINCKGEIIYPEKCPLPEPFVVEGCKDSAIVDLNETSIQSLGRIVQVNATIKNVCPGKRVAVAIMLTETDKNGVEYARGTKTITLQPFEGDSCKNVTLGCIHFVVPEDLDVSGTADAICNDRKFNARVMANYVDTDFVCCDTGVTDII